MSQPTHSLQKIEVGTRVKVINASSCYADQFGTVTGPNVPGSQRWLVAIDDDPKLDWVSFYESELRRASTSATG